MAQHMVYLGKQPMCTSEEFTVVAIMFYKCQLSQGS